MAEISIIVPVYKAESYLRDCLDSILCQSFSDFELILVDDGSPDNSGAICEEYAKKDSRIRVLHQENQGQAAARNHALKIARGAWLCYVDSDDLIHPRMVEVLYDAVKDGKAGISMCKMLEATALPEDFMEERAVSFETIPMDEEHLTALFDKEDYPGWVACAKLIPREVVERYPFRPGRVYEDNEAVCRWIVAGKRIAMSQEKLYFYRTNPVSTTQSDFSLKKLDYLWALESIIRFYHGLGYASLVERFVSLYAEAAAGSHTRVLLELGKPEVTKAIRRNARKLFREHKVPLKRESFETMLSAMYPRLVKLYWPMEAIARRLGLAPKRERGGEP